MNFLDRKLIKYFEDTPKLVNSFKTSRKNFAKTLAWEVVYSYIGIWMFFKILPVLPVSIRLIPLAVMYTLWIGLLLIEEALKEPVNRRDYIYGNGGGLGLFFFAIPLIIPVSDNFLKETDNYYLIPNYVFLTYPFFVTVFCLFVLGLIPFFKNRFDPISEVISLPHRHVNDFMMSLYHILLKFLVLLSPSHEQIKREIVEGVEAKALAEEERRAKDANSFILDRAYILPRLNLLEPTVKRFVEQRMDNYYDGFNEILVILAFILPKNMSVDTKKQILQNCVNSVTKKYFKLHPGNNFLENPKLIEGFWGDMTENQIKRVMTGACNYNHLRKLILGYVEAGEIPCHKAKTFEEFYGESQVRNMINPVLKKITLEGYEVKALESKSDFMVARNDFKNCVKAYFQSSTLDIVCLYQDKKPVACFSVNKELYLEEIKAPFNREVNVDLKNKVKKALKEIKPLAKDLSLAS